MDKLYFADYHVLLPSEEDIMNDGIFVFQNDARNQRNVSAPEIRIPTSVIRRQNILQG